MESLSWQGEAGLWAWLLWGWARRPERCLSGTPTTASVCSGVNPPSLFQSITYIQKHNIGVSVACFYCLYPILYAWNTLLEKIHHTGIWVDSWGTAGWLQGYCRMCRPHHTTPGAYHSSVYTVYIFLSLLSQDLNTLSVSQCFLHISSYHIRHWSRDHSVPDIFSCYKDIYTKPYDVAREVLSFLFYWNVVTYLPEWHLLQILSMFICISESGWTKMLKRVYGYLYGIVHKAQSHGLI